MQLLETEILDQVNPKDLNLNNYSNDIPIVSFLEAELGYPNDLHNLHNGYPLENEKIEVKQKCSPNINYKSQKSDLLLGKNKKRIPNLGHKRK